MGWVLQWYVMCGAACIPLPLLPKQVAYLLVAPCFGTPRGGWLLACQRLPFRCRLRPSLAPFLRRPHHCFSALPSLMVSLKVVVCWVASFRLATVRWVVVAVAPTPSCLRYKNWMALGIHGHGLIQVLMGGSQATPQTTPFGRRAEVRPAAKGTRHLTPPSQPSATNHPALHTTSYVTCGGRGLVLG